MQDRMVHDAITDLFSAASLTEKSVDIKISTLSQFLFHQPRVVLRLHFDINNNVEDDVVVSLSRIHHNTLNLWLQQNC